MFSRGWAAVVCGAVCGAALCAAGPVVAAEPPEDAAAPAEGAAPPASQPAEDPTLVMAQRLFEEGSQAYNLGNFEVAIAKFEAAYDLTRATALLYNIAQAYTRRHEVDRDPELLRKARVLFTNYIKISEASGEEPRDARDRVAEIDAKLAAIEAERREAERRAAAAAPPPRRSYRPGAVGIAGYVGLGVGLALGSGLGVTGFVSAARLQAQHDVEAAALPLPAAREALYDEGLGKARGLAYAGLGVGAALTVAGVVMVAVDAARGKKAGQRAALGAGGLLVRF